MPLREKLHYGLEMAAVLGPVNASIMTALPDAIVAHVASPEGRALRRRLGPRGWGSLSPAAAALAAADLVKHHEVGLEPAELAMTTVGRTIGDLPLAVATSGDLLALSLPHDLFDGAAAWSEFAGFLHLAAGLPAPARPGRMLTRPVLDTMRAAGLTNRETFRSARTARHEQEGRSIPPAPLPAPLSLDDVDRRRSWIQVYLGVDDTRRLESTRSTEHAAATGRAAMASRSMKLVEVVLAGLREGFRSDQDLPLRLSIDLRRYAPRGARIAGPFSTAYPFGALRSSPSSAPALTARLSDAVKSKGPLMALVGDLVGLAKQRLQHPLRRTTAGSELDAVDVGISVLPPLLPEGFWASSEHRVDGAFQFHPTRPTTPLVQIADLGDVIAVSVWDEARVIDPVAFARGITNALAARVEPAVARRG